MPARQIRSAEYFEQTQTDFHSVIIARRLETTHVANYTLKQHVGCGPPKHACVCVGPSYSAVQSVSPISDFTSVFVDFASMSSGSSCCFRSCNMLNKKFGRRLHSKKRSDLGVVTDADLKCQGPCESGPVRSPAPCIAEIICLFAKHLFFT
jgi:hypothetical protein